MKIKLTQGKYALVDNEDFEELSKWKWCFNGRYAIRRKNHRTIYMHRVINNTLEGFETDHINRNKLDNRRKNLRSVTASQNRINLNIRKDNTSGYKGITWDKLKQRWKARIWIQGEQIVLGSFKQIKSASEARSKAELEYYNFGA